MQIFMDFQNFANVYLVSCKVLKAVKIKFDTSYCDVRPNLDGPVVAHECCMHIFSTTLLVEQGWSQFISLCPPAIASSG